MPEGPTAQPYVVSLGNGSYRVTSEGRSRLAYAVASAGVVWVFFDGRVYVLPGIRDPGSGTRESDRISNARFQVPDPGSRIPDPGKLLASPMPATVVAINVEPGQQVTQGHVMIMLEAMKMELPVTAPHDGRVKAILCRLGELVAPGVPLLELE